MVYCAWRGMVAHHCFVERFLPGGDLFKWIETKNRFTVVPRSWDDTVA